MDEFLTGETVALLFSRVVTVESVNVNHFFRWYDKQIFMFFGNEFLHHCGKQIFMSGGKHFFTPAAVKSAYRAHVERLFFRCQGCWKVIYRMWLEL